MVQKYQSPVRVYKWPFELVMMVCILFVKCHFFVFVVKDKGVTNITGETVIVN